MDDEISFRNRFLKKNENEKRKRTKKKPNKINPPDEFRSVPKLTI